MSEAASITHSFSEEHNTRKPLLVVAGNHGLEPDALNVLKWTRGVPNVRRVVGSYRAIVEGKRWLDGDINMSRAYPGNPKASHSYSLQRAAVITGIVDRLPYQGIIEVHSSLADNIDVGWVCLEQSQGESGTLPDTALDQSSPMLRPAYTTQTSDEAILRLLRMGVRNFVITGRPLNLLGNERTSLIDIGTESLFKDPDHCRECLGWLANEYDAAQDRADIITERTYVPGAYEPNEELTISVFQHDGWVPHGARDMYGLPGNMNTLQPINQRKARRLGLPVGSVALTWKRTNPAIAGEVLTPYMGRLPGILGWLTRTSRSPLALTTAS